MSGHKDDWCDAEPCEHDCDETCDVYQTCNLRPAETGGGPVGLGPEWGS